MHNYLKWNENQIQLTGRQLWRDIFLSSLVLNINFMNESLDIWTWNTWYVYVITISAQVVRYKRPYFTLYKLGNGTHLTLHCSWTKELIGLGTQTYLCYKHINWYRADQHPSDTLHIPLQVTMVRCSCRELIQGQLTNYKLMPIDFHKSHISSVIPLFYTQHMQSISKKTWAFYSLDMH